jgi:hypothetical protein
MDGHLLRFPRPLVALLALATLTLAVAAAPAAARADDSPAVRWPAGGPALRTALAMGGEHWGMSPCDGRVAMTWTGLDAGVNAQSSWANDVDPYLQPSSNTDCEIALSTGTEWDWVKLCSIVVHEVGHLTGHDHVDDPDDIMFYAYVEPAPECAATPEPAASGPPPAATAPVKATPRQAKKASAPKRKAAKPKKAKGRKAHAPAHRRHR